MSKIAHTAADLKQFVTPAGDLAITRFTRGNNPAGQSWCGSWAEWLADFRAATATPWHDQAAVVDAMLRIEAEAEGGEAQERLDKLITECKLSLPAEFGGILRDDRRRADNVLVVNRLFLDLDGVEAAAAERLRHLFEELGLNYCLVESSTSRMETLNGARLPLKVHGYLQIAPVGMPKRADVPTALISAWWQTAYRAVAAALMQTAECSGDEVDVDDKATDLARMSYIPHIPPRKPGRSFRPAEGDEVGGGALDFVKLALALGVEPMPSRQVNEEVVVKTKPAKVAKEKTGEKAAAKKKASPARAAKPAKPAATTAGLTPGHTNGSLLELAFTIFGQQGLRLTKGYFERLAKAATERRNPLTAADFGRPLNYFRGPAAGGKRHVHCPWQCESGGAGAESSTTIFSEGGPDADGGGFVCQHSGCAAAAGGPLKTADVLRLARYVVLMTGDDFPEREGEIDVDPDDGGGMTDENKKIVGQAIRDMNKRHAVVRIGSKLAVLNGDGIMTKEALFDWYVNKPVWLIDEDGKEMKVCRAALWWHSPRRREYDKMEFRPELTRAAAAARGIHNLWQGFAVERNPDGDCSLFYEHLWQNICQEDEQLYRYVYAWFANMVQRPHRRPGVGLVLQSKGLGTGKSIVAQVMGHLIGGRTTGAYYEATQPRQVTGHFNDHLEKCLLLHAAEAVWAGSRGDESVLKSLVTDPTLSVERKGYPCYQAPNYLHLIVSSNSDWVVPAQADERRWCVVEVGEGRKQDAAFFGAMMEQLQGGGYGKLLDDLLSANVEAVDLRKVPNTLALQKQKMASLPPIDAWLFEAVGHGEVPGSKRAVTVMTDTIEGATAKTEVAQRMLSPQPWHDNSETEIGRRELLEAFHDFCGRHRHHKPNERAFGILLQSSGLTINNRHRGSYWLPPLSSVRLHLSRKYGLKAEKAASPTVNDYAAAPN
jgi:hypothetical protein